MKILVVNWQDIKNPLAGGAEVHLHRTFEPIVRMGHEVTLVCSSFPGAAREEIINGIRVIRRGGRFLFNFRFMYEYLTRLRNQRFDVVVDDMNKIPFFTPLFVKQPIVGIVHHLFGKSIFLETIFPVALYVYWMERLALTLYKSRRTTFFAVSPSTQRDLVKVGLHDDQIVLVPEGIDHQLYRSNPTAKSTTPLIASFGRLKRYKSVDQLLQALPLVLPKVPTLQVKIIGGGDDRERLEALVGEMNLSDTVEFTGFVSEEKKVELLQVVWCQVTTSSKEGWGLTVLEANACGTPAIASNVEGLRDAVRDEETGLLYEYGNINNLSEKIIRILTDEQLRDKLTANAVEWARKFDWEESAKQTLRLLEKEIP